MVNKRLPHFRHLLTFGFCRFYCRYNYRKAVMQQREMQEAIGSGKLSEYSRLSPAERRKKDQEWVESLRRSRPKDYRDD